MKIKSGAAEVAGWKDMEVYKIHGLGPHHDPVQGRRPSLNSRICETIRCRWPHCLFLLSTVTLTLVVLFKWVALDVIIQRQIYQEVRLVEGSDTWNKWVNVPYPVIIRFYFFNITNFQDFERGAKPSLQEVGPYTYEERRFKQILAVDKEQDTIRYRQPVYYYFRRDLSGGPEEDRVILINVPFITVAKISKELTNFQLAYTFTDRSLRDRGERLFNRYSVREYLFEGFPVQSYVSFLSNPMVQLFGSAPIPESFGGSRFGFYKGRNGSDDGEYVVASGSRVPEDFGKILSWEGKTKLSHFTGMCNLINGTDGSIFHPFIKKTDILRFYNPEICRSMYFVFAEELVVKGIQAYRFKLPHPKAIFEHADFCFCSPKPRECLKQGVFNLSPCRDGAPVSFSAPHFYQSWEPYLQGVDGLHPTEEAHDTYIDVEPNTGMLLGAKKRLQFNIEVEPNPNMPTIRNVRKVLLPFMWAEESVEIPDDIANDFKARFYDTVHMANKVAIAGLLGSSILIFVSILGCLYVTCEGRLDRKASMNQSEKSSQSNESAISRVSSIKSRKSTSSQDVGTNTVTCESKETMTGEALD